MYISNIKFITYHKHVMCISMCVAIRFSIFPNRHHLCFAEEPPEQLDVRLVDALGLHHLPVIPKLVLQLLLAGPRRHEDAAVAVAANQ